MTCREFSDQAFLVRYLLSFSSFPAGLFHGASPPLRPPRLSITFTPYLCSFLVPPLRPGSLYPSVPSCPLHVSPPLCPISLYPSVSSCCFLVSPPLSLSLHNSHAYSIYKQYYYNQNIQMSSINTAK